MNKKGIGILIILVAVLIIAAIIIALITGFEVVEQARGGDLLPALETQTIGIIVGIILVFVAVLIAAVFILFKR